MSQVYPIGYCRGSIYPCDVHHICHGYDNIRFVITSFRITLYKIACAWDRQRMSWITRSPEYLLLTHLLSISYIGKILQIL